jgi:sucrose-6F-phosphate phosphohydrolase
MSKFLLITDLDDTLVGDHEAMERLNRSLRVRRQQLYLVYATGRSYSSARRLQAQAGLLEPDYWITSVGSEIYHRGEVNRQWAEYLCQDWDREAVWAIAERLPFLSPQPPREQNPLKASFWLKQTADIATIERLEAELQQAQLSAQVIFSSGRDVDILPCRGNKGQAATYLRQWLGIPPEETLVCGDSGNDISLFQQPARGAIVNNARPELLQWYYERCHPWHYLAKSPYAGGILEALHHFNFVEFSNFSS